MTAGLPGVGIGGLFYLATALLMPFRSLLVVAIGRDADARWTLALRQAAIAAAMLGTVWASGWALGWIFAQLAPQAMAATLTPTPQVQNAIRTATVLGSIGTLLLVLMLVQVARVLLPPRLVVRPVDTGMAAVKSVA